MSDSHGALPPPPGVTPNFQHPDASLNVLNLVVQILVISLVSPFVWLRVYTRLKFQRGLNKEDWTCVIAWIMFLLYSTSAILMGRFGGGIHQWEVTNRDMRDFLKVVYGGSIIYGLTAYSIKISLLLIFTRVFALLKKTTYSIYAFMFAMLCYYFTIIVIKARICTPIPSFWDRNIIGKCFDEQTLFIADTVMSGITDLAVLVIPIPLIWNLHMPLKKKIRVLVLLGAGGIAVAASLARLVMVVQGVDNPDLTWSIVRFNLLGTAETSIGLICASLPACNAFFAHYGSSFFTSRSTNSKNSDAAIDVEFESGGSRSAKSGRRVPRSMPTWFEDLGSDSDILVSIDPNREDVMTRNHEDVQKKGTCLVSVVAREGETGIAR